jgi:hypothetical protein
MAATAFAARVRAPRARTTPGRLTLLIGVLLVLSLGWGGFGGWVVASYSGTARAVAYTDEPLSLRAQQLYADLADADVTITTAYLRVGPGSAPSTRVPRQRFGADLADASRQLAVLSASSPGPEVTSAVATIVGELPVYGHDVAIAETEYDQGVYPAGGSFIEVASIDAHLTLLPAARIVYQAENATVTSAEGRATSAPLVITAVVLGIVTVAVLVGVAIWLARRTNRRFNVGLVVAGAALLISGVWLANAFAVAFSDLSTAISQGAVPAEAAAQASIDIEAIRGDSILNLIARSGTPSLSQDSAAQQASVTALMSAASWQSSPASRAGRAGKKARAAEDSWYLSNGQAFQYGVELNYAAEQRLVLDTGPGGLASGYSNLLEELVTIRETAQNTFQASADAGAGAFAGLQVAVIVAALVMAAASAWGLSQRLREYR